MVALWVLQSGQHSIRTTPTVVLHAADDGTVPVSSAREFVEALRGAGGAVAYREWPTGGHGEIMLSLMGRTFLEDLEPAGLAAISSAFVQSEVTSLPCVGTQPTLEGLVGVL